MRWKRARRSSNVEDRRGRRVAAGGGLGLVGIVIVVVISLVLGKNPIEMLGLVGDMAGTAPAGETRGPAPDPNDPAIAFVESILGETEDVWTALIGPDYPAPRLIVFSDRVRSACGGASSAMGPFYCPADQQIYIDLSFFAEMQRSLGGGGDFAEAYVIAHEVGHHVQTVTGLSAPVTAARRAGRNVEGDGGLLVRQELQADCLSASGPITPRIAMTGWNRAISRKRLQPPRRSATTRCSGAPGAKSYRMLSPTAPPSSACAGSAGVSTTAIRHAATRSAPRRSDYIPFLRCWSLLRRLSRPEGQKTAELVKVRRPRLDDQPYRK